jgi:Holliday junction resolvase-like predicted endonuclease
MIRQFTSKTQQIGQIGEEKALVFLVKLGFTILGQNINNRHGEIDIVANLLFL